MNDSISTKIKFLKKFHTEDIPNKNQSLFDHLGGTRDKLKDMGAEEYIQDAGLFHSIYGTASFKHQTVSDRSVITSLIGEEAEHLVYLFCTLTKPRTQHILALEDYKIRNDLLLISAANEYDMSLKSEMSMEEAYGHIGFDSGRN